MSIETAADLVQILANSVQSRGLDAHALRKRTGISEERLKLIECGAWQSLTVKEIALVMDALGLDLGAL
ncbi:hypothetical protein WMC41_30780 (plasmid) [Shinella yambaruensis]|uniref:hypothetical protein n=1 Tax=Shinella TaxID=323620 RepID=UPI00258AC851|nr:hypothetical protein [Shinella sp.]MCW5712426.1 hypothetical protein [Shinella sp.]